MVEEPRFALLCPACPYPANLYADLSHPFGEGYAVLAHDLWRNSGPNSKTVSLPGSPERR